MIAKRRSIVLSSPLSLLIILGLTISPYYSCISCQVCCERFEPKASTKGAFTISTSAFTFPFVRNHSKQLVKRNTYTTSLRSSLQRTPSINNDIKSSGQASKENSTKDMESNFRYFTIESVSASRKKRNGGLILQRNHSRRRIMQQGLAGVAALFTSSMLDDNNTRFTGSSPTSMENFCQNVNWLRPPPALADNEGDGSSREISYQELGKGYGYQLVIPSNFEKGGKPVKTHLNEVNFNSSTIKGYQFGITVDPVRINSIVEFGAPSEVAARVVTAELNRDGILDITMGDDPTDVKDRNEIVYYLIDYISDGKRGKKHLYTKTVINQGKLYVLTGQVKVADETPTIIKEIKQTLQTFSVVANL